jgi:hypothetical protein
VTSLPAAARRTLTARFDEDEVVVYQAYPEELGRELARLGRFGGSWRFDRHTRVQPSWRWTMHRYSWGDRQDRSRLLAIRLHRAGFDAMLNAALKEEFDPEIYPSKRAWRLALRFSPVLVEWDADVARFVILGPLIRTFAETWVAGIEDITAFARERRAAGGGPPESAYPLAAETARRIGAESP